ncbi:Neurochondrin-domain-containing protein [Peziza echinospora]|nr:Neurochondrin-domain-containing protein [Peziza echinospora]
MAESNPAQQGPSADSQTLSQCISYLQAKDDTARFVGLAMLVPVLKNVTDTAILGKLWEAMNYKFLDRLLKSGKSSKAPPAQAKDMVELAVNIVHAFSILLPGASENPSLTQRTPGLIAALTSSSTDTVSTILETLAVFATGGNGAEALLQTENLQPLLDVAPNYEHGPDTMLYACINVLGREGGVELVSRALPNILDAFSKALITDDKATRLRLLSFFSDILSRLPSSLLPQSTEWVSNIYKGIRAIITTTHSEQDRIYITIICSSLLHTYPPSLLFQTSGAPPPTRSGKSFTFFFIRLLLIDIRATFPALLEQLSSPSYPIISQRLSADFDIIAAFIGYLVLLDSLEQVELDPESLLTLRKEIGETFSLTIEFLRDRWDAEFAGAAGYEMEEISDDHHPPRDGRTLDLTWQAKDVEGGAPRDPLVISAVRSLSLWLREDESLRKEAGGIMDLFLGLWRISVEDHTRGKSQQQHQLTIDYRLWLVGALEGTIAEKNGREAFQNQGGWDLLWNDIKRTYTHTNASTAHMDADEAVRLAVEEIRVLVEFIREASFMEISHLDNKFLEAARIARVSDVPAAGGVTPWVTLDIAVLQLAAACLRKIPRDSRVQRGPEAEKVRTLTRRLGAYVQGNGGAGVENQEEAVYMLAEVMDDLGLV